MKMKIEGLKGPGGSGWNRKRLCRFETAGPDDSAMFFSTVPLKVLLCLVHKGSNGRFPAG